MLGVPYPMWVGGQSVALPNVDGWTQFWPRDDDGSACVVD
eukprot:CAMPEP_0194739266 /NCGR_PEP_ID=MMETSP0296-20130528/87985_1 /TAXON_ID=39354 /ORGANISM="Heterosigma akashiwo, Strain CCMP2393" /LENGTH=39 /DNA_ID= /DNA_START= /DNA_END= /DNA_ORIENTATION=